MKEATKTVLIAAIAILLITITGMVLMAITSLK
jgi:hypothetical protein